MNNYEGRDNYGRPKSEYIEKISEMDEGELRTECYNMVYQSARCNNNYRADWHWMVDACYDESKRRDDKGSIYVSAYNECYKDNVG